MKITFVGTGYVGLVSGVMMSHLGHDVVCLDVDRDKINTLKQKISPIYELGLNDYIDQYANTSRLEFLHGYDESIKNTECLFITVGTPPKENGDADLSLIFKAVDSASEYIDLNKCVIVLKSTVPPGTCELVRERVLRNNKNVYVVSNPEFLREGNAVKDFLEPDRIVIGYSSEHELQTMRQVYEPLTSKGVPLIETDLKTSELIKYASNTFLANKIAFINEMADLCEVANADIGDLSKGIGLDKRIGPDFLNAGPGFGGSCFPKDILALQHFAKTTNTDSLILDAIIEANTSRPRNIVQKISNALGGSLPNKKIAVLGLTYKAGTDDLRSSPAIELISLLQEEGVVITAYDPKGMPNIDKYLENLDCRDSILDAATGVDAIIIATEWPEFLEMDLEAIRKIVRGPKIIDLRNVFSPKLMAESGFSYHSIGR